MGEVRYPTRDELEARREDIVASVGRSEASLREDAEFGVLTGEEYEALDELDVIAFLLSESSTDIA